MVLHPNLKLPKETIMDNVVLMFSPTDEKTPYEKGENGTVIRFSRFINFLNVPRHGPSLKEY